MICIVKGYVDNIYFFIEFFYVWLKNWVFGNCVEWIKLNLLGMDIFDERERECNNGVLM